MTDTNIKNNNSSVMANVKEKVYFSTVSVAKWVKSLIRSAIRICFCFLAVYFLISTGIIDMLWAKIFGEGVSESNLKAHFIPGEVAITNYDISNKLSELNEIITYEYSFSGMCNVSNSREVLGMSIWGTNKSMDIYYEGIVKAGINSSEIDVSLNEKSNLITVKLPDAEIYDYYFTSQHVSNEKNNIFNPIGGSDVNDALTPELENKVEEAIEAGLLDEAYENAKVQINDLFTEFAVVGYRVEFM